jgi:hypothetical protein
MVAPCLLAITSVTYASDKDLTILRLFDGITHVSLRPNKDVGGYSVTLHTDAEWKEICEKADAATKAIEDAEARIVKLNESRQELEGNREGQRAVRKEIDTVIQERFGYMPDKNRPSLISEIVGVSDELLLVKANDGTVTAIPIRHISSIQMSKRAIPDAAGE